MKIALIGLPQVGKKTVFSLLTGLDYSQLLTRGEYLVGIVKVADPRIDKLSAMYNPQKTRTTEIECTLAPAPPAESKPREQWLNKLKDMDAFCHVVRSFDDPILSQAGGTVDALRDIDAMNLELAISDLSLVELRLHRIAQDQKRKFDPNRKVEEELLGKLKPHLESGKSLREYAFSESEEKQVRHLQFLTLKGLVTVLNLGESNFPNAALVEAARAKLTGPRTGVAALCAKLEMEVAQIADPAEREEFLKELGIEEPAIHVLTRLCFRTLGYISFFTVGEDEVRAWTTRCGATAAEAAGAIHTDLARGFIRADVMKYADLISAGVGCPGPAAELRLKEQGKLMRKGKEYIVEDGDIMSFHHSG